MRRGMPIRANRAPIIKLASSKPSMSKPPSFAPFIQGAIKGIKSDAKSGIKMMANVLAVSRVLHGRSVLAQQVFIVE
jgi:hypothetical protein